MSSPNKTDKICLIGSGPSSIHMSLMLQDRGFQDVTIYEASNRIGGKCYTVNHNNCPFDLGAGVVPGNSEITKLCDRFNIDLVPMTIIRKNHSLNKIQKWNAKTKFSLFMFRLLFLKKLNKMMDYYSNESPLFDENDERWKDLSLVFSITLKRHGLTPVISFLNDILITYGYGACTEIPSFYAIEFFRIWLKSFSLFDLFLTKDGYQKFWEKVALDSKIKIEFNHPIENIKIENDKITLVSKTKNITCDFLINSVPNLVNTAFGREYNIFDKVHSHKYPVGILDEKPTPYLSEMCYDAPPLQVNFIAAQMKCRNIDVKDIESFSFYSGPKYHNCIERKNQEYEDVVTQSLESYFKKDPSTFSLHHLTIWDYFPQFREQDLRNGILAKIFKEQGINNIWHIGSHCCFESVPNVIDYNFKILKKFSLL
jgi:hypothetical protein